MGKEKGIFNLLWDMYNEAMDSNNPGQVIGRYAGIIEDRLENSGNSRSTQSLKLYTTEQLQEEIDDREE